MVKQPHHQKVVQQFGQQAAAYLTSQVHAKGQDLQQLQQLLHSYPQASLLDLGSGAGHVSFTAAPSVTRVIAYDLSAQMLQVVAQTAKQKGYHNICTEQGPAEQLPFTDNLFDIIVSRYSAHHWHDVGKALREAFRVLKKGGKLIIMDVVSPGHPVLDIWLQTVEALRDTSHVRDYTPGEWLTFISESGFLVEQLKQYKLTLTFDSWITRMRTPEVMVKAIRAYQLAASPDVNDYFALTADGSFTSDMMVIEAVKY